MFLKNPIHVKQLEVKSIFKYFNQKIDKAKRNMSFKNIYIPIKLCKKQK